MNPRTLIILIIALLLSLVAFPIYRGLSPFFTAMRTMPSYKSYASVQEAEQRLKTNPSDTLALQTLLYAHSQELRRATTAARQREILSKQLPYAERLYALEPNNTTYADNLAIALTGLQRYEEAVPLLEKVAAAGTVHSDGAKSLLTKIRRAQGQRNSVNRADTSSQAGQKY